MYTLPGLFFTSFTSEPNKLTWLSAFWKTEFYKVDEESEILIEVKMFLKKLSIFNPKDCVSIVKWTNYVKSDLFDRALLALPMCGLKMVSCKANAYIYYFIIKKKVVL